MNVYADSLAIDRRWTMIVRRTTTDVHVIPERLKDVALAHWTCSMLEQPRIDASLVEDVSEKWRRHRTKDVPARQETNNISGTVGVNADRAIRVEFLIANANRSSRDASEGFLGSIEQPPLKAILGMGVTKALNVVENEPGERDDHQDDEGDADEED